ncbi:MAG: ABC transporter permease [Candidatus Pacebacteria bacterium]|nr:ABC transporter permease [Candidatus Paceibacterota bacterium]
MSSIISAIELAIQAFKSHKVRTSLAILGVTIGISSIIVVFSAGEGISGLLLGQIEAFGSDTIQVEIKVPSSKTGAASETQSAISLMQGAQVTTLDLDDLEDVVKIPNIENGYSILMTQESATYKNEIHRTYIWSTNASFMDIDRTEIQEGRFFTKAENRSLAQVVVLGTNIKEKLFGDNDPIGKSIKIRDTRFRVIGVMGERGSVMTFDFDDFIYVPISTMHKRIMGVSFLHNIILKVKDMSIVEETLEEIRIVLRDNHDIDPPKEQLEGWTNTGKDDFRVVSMTEILDIWNEISSTLTLLLLAIVAVSLVVGGVGVMNIMYVIVSERTPEIGLRKAVGAKYSDIMWQFLIESILITLIGGIIGTIIGILIAYMISIGANYSGIDWNFVIPIKAFMTAFLFSIIFGIIFGANPARKAAKMDPIDALWSEQ